MVQSADRNPVMPGDGHMRLDRLQATKEGGQALILFTFMLCVLFLAVMATVDVGFFLHNRENAQQTADAAALAGAQDLPGSTTQAQADALTYVTKNGLSTTNTVITFGCTSQVSTICQTGDGRYDTIYVTQKAPSPTYFGGVLSVLGFNNCWVKGCTASATAGACRGACGPIGTGPADIMTVLDHSGSMSDANLTNAKNAISSMFTNFDYTYQRVGLGMTPPLTSTTSCNSISTWSASPQVWMPSPLTSTFQTKPHVLNNNSSPVKEAACVNRTTGLTDYPLGSGHTDIGSPLQAVTNELNTNGRAGVTHGIILITDGAANVAPWTTTTTTTPHTTTTVTPDDTGLLNCTTSGSTAPVTVNSGDNDGYQTSESNACSPDNNYASDGTSSNGSGSSASQVSCPNTTGSSGSSSTNNGGTGANKKDKHVFANYSISLPSNPTVTGITVRIDGKVSSTSGTRMFCVQVSQDGGLTYSNAQSATLSSTSERTYLFGDSSDLWGFASWSATQLNNTNFRVRVTDVANDTTRIFYIDDIQVQVDYTTSVTTTTYTTTTTTTFTNSQGPCDWAGQQATAAKAAGIEVFVIGFGVSSSEKCTNGELTNSPYYNMSANSFLQSLATDASHYYNQPKTEDLTVIFNAIGSQLTSGSRLIQ